MFNFAWSEIAVIAVVALIAIGPKDMPVAIKAVAAAIKKARRMASEFQTHVDEMVREANLEDVRDQLSAFRNLDVTTALERAVDPDGGLRSTFTDDPLRETGADGTEAETVGELGVADFPRPFDADAIAPIDPATAPAFIPPGAIAAHAAQAGEDVAGTARDNSAGTAREDIAAAPAFIPPEVASRLGASPTR